MAMPMMGAIHISRRWPAAMSCDCPVHSMRSPGSRCSSPADWVRSSASSAART